MTITLRDYQRACVDALFAYFGRSSGNPLAVCPTGSGKSLIIAAFCREAIEAFPSTRILIATHRAELIEQDARAIQRFWASADVGIYSAGLGMRQVRPITVAGVQSIVNAKGLPPFDLLLVDEAHLIPHSGEGQYRTLIKKLSEANDALKVVGFTATPYRLNGGRLTRGDGKIFSSIAYDIPVQRLVDEGHLSPLVSPTTHGSYSTAGVGVSGGEYKPGELAAKVESQDDITRAALTEAAQLAHDRKSWLVFCVSIEHARQAAAHLFALGVSAAVVTGDDDMGARKTKIEAYKRGDVRALVSCDVLTIGFDAPATDALVILRPTQSTGLYVQICGRGMRLAPGKSDCLVLDYGDNIERHGPITAVRPKESKDTDALRFKVCPQCDGEVQKHKSECPECGYIWPRIERQIDHAKKAATRAVMGPPPEPEWINVSDVDYAVHIKAADPPPPPTMRVRYYTGNLARKDYSEWVCPEHGGFATEKFWRWWAKRGGTMPAPTTTQEAVDRARAGELRPVEAIVAEQDGKFWRIKDARLGERKPAPIVVAGREPGSDDDIDYDGPSSLVAEIWGEEEIPF